VNIGVEAFLRRRQIDIVPPKDFAAVRRQPPTISDRQINDDRRKRRADRRE